MNNNYGERRRAGWIRSLYYLTGWGWLKRFGWYREEENTKPTPLLIDDSNGSLTKTTHEDEAELSQEDFETLHRLGISMRPPLESFLESPEGLSDLKRIFKFILEREKEMQQEQANERHD